MLSLAEAAHFAQGELLGSDAQLKRIVIDSRQITPGDLFVAIRGERFDAHEFLAQAFAQGAVAAVVHAQFSFGQPAQQRLIVVDDTRLALGRIAASWRARFSCPVIAITGSNGKTTVKEMTRAILRAHAGDAAVLANSGNFNNDIGLPLTLLQLNEAHRYAVVEMGMNHPGELRALSALAQADIALINNAHRAHLGGFESLEGIALAKAEIFSGLKVTGTAVFNGEDRHADLFAQAAAGHRIVRFGLASGDIYARSHNLGVDGSIVTIAHAAAQIDVRLPVAGQHNVLNALAATALALELKIDPATIVRGLAHFNGVKRRLQKKTAFNGATILDDSYNANPESMKVGLEVLMRMRAPRWFVMGDIGELGPSAAQLHAEIGHTAQEMGVDKMLTLGPLSQYGAEAYGAQAQHFSELDALLTYLKNTLPSNATVLVKGSRFMQMERIVDYLVERGNEGG